jgi:hypothetical protein
MISCMYVVQFLCAIPLQCFKTEYLANIVCVLDDEGRKGDTQALSFADLLRPQSSDALIGFPCVYTLKIPL